MASDPDNDNVYGQLDILSGETVIATINSSTVGSGTAFTWPPVPSGVLPTNNQTAVFSYRARIRDSRVAGPDSGRCYFTIDQIRPSPPTLSSTDYPNGVAVRSVAEADTVTLTKATSDNDVAGFRYGFSLDRITMWAPVRTDGAASIPITLWRSIPGSAIGIDRDLYVQAIDPGRQRQRHHDRVAADRTRPNGHRDARSR